MKTGDKVIVHLTINSFGACDFEAIIKYAPSEAGDCWILDATIIGEQKEIILNPSACHYLGMEIINDL